jgi:PAS domain S-box-containing protein
MQTEQAGITVLCVDDDPDVVDLAATFLERQEEDFAVVTATSASEGLDRLAEGGVDCVVSDYDMPGQDGIEFLEAVRGAHGDLPFVLFTGKGSETVASEAISAGATDYLQKGAGTEQYELLANRVRNAVERYRADRRAAELDRIRTLASDVNQALVRADSREAAETSVCEAFSESDPYLFAWIGGVDPATDRVEPRASAGVGEGYLSEVTVTADDSPTGRGPGGTALREGRVVVAQDVREDSGFEPWRAAAAEYGFRGVAAIPLEHEGERYGILAVYADRPGAFDADERELLAELGDDVAHVLHSFEVEDRLREERDRRRALFENAPGPVVAGEITGGGSEYRVTDVNDAFEDVFGYDADSVVGGDIADLMVPESGRDRHETIRERTAAGEPAVTEVERRTATGPRKFLLQVVPYGTDGDRADGFYAWSTDVTERERRKRAVERLHETSRALTSAETRQAAAETVVEAARDILDLPVNAVHRYDESADGLVPVAWTAEVEELIGDPPTLTRGDSLAWEVFETGEAQTYDDVSTVEGRHDPETPVRSDLIMPLGDHGVLIAGSSEADAFDETDISLARTLAAHARTTFDRIEREQKLTALHDVATALERDDSVESVCERTVGASERILEFDLSVVDIEDDGYLEKAAISEEIPEGATARMSVESGLAGETYRTGESMLVGDLAECEVAEPQGPYRSAVSIPVGDHGVFQAVAEEPGAFDEADLELAELLVRHAENALDRLEHERRLERQNERLEEFASIVSHDLRNPLNVATGRLELARAESDDDNLVAVARAHEQMESLIEDLLALARTGDDATDLEPVELADVVEQCWRNVETHEATLAVETGRRVRADRGQLRRLLENLFRNAVEHGREDATVTVGDTDDGFYVADDGRGIPPDERDRVFESGYSTSDDSTGFGLKIVERIADAHGWSVDVTESETGGVPDEQSESEARETESPGARFEFATDANGVDEN